MIKTILIVLFAFTNASLGNAVPAKSNAANAKVRKFIEQVLLAGPALTESELGTQNETRLVKSFKLLSIKRSGDVTTAKVSLQIDGLRLRDERTHRFSERSIREGRETIEISLRETEGRFILLNLEPAKYQLRTKSIDKAN